MHIFIAGICGTFMAGIAQLAQSMGYRVSGCDTNVYPPMSDVLANAGIEVMEGYQPEHLPNDISSVIIGNALSRGNLLVEHVLANQIHYQSGPEWLKDAVLRDRKVIAVAGTHGKTTTASMIAWILDSAGLSPGFLIGGQPGNFSETARLGSGEFFVIEADEYDTAFFDKRSKFVHYLPDIAVLNNLEFDHADIFFDLDQIKTQFHHLIRIVPENGKIIINQDESDLKDVLSQGSWSPVSGFSAKDTSAEWYAKSGSAAAVQFDVAHNGNFHSSIQWGCIGHHNMLNALAAIASASEAGVSAEHSAEALTFFKPSARRLEKMTYSGSTVLYQDFAHHPTAIKTTLEALHARYPEKRILAIIEPRSNTMRMGHHLDQLGASLGCADETWFYTPALLDWQPEKLTAKNPIHVFSDAQALIDEIIRNCEADTSEDGSVIIAMSNGGFDAIPKRLADRLKNATF